MKRTEFDYSKHRDLVEKEFFLEEHIGTFPIMNKPETALDGYKSIHEAKSGGAYYCLHKFKRNLQIVIKYNLSAWHYTQIPRKNAAQLMDIKEIELWRAKKKSSMFGNTVLELIPILPF
jgi:hypothetical protein